MHYLKLSAIFITFYLILMIMKDRPRDLPRDLIFYRLLDDISMIEILRIIYGKRNPEMFHSIE